MLFYMRFSHSVYSFDILWLVDASPHFLFWYSHSILPVCVSLSFLFHKDTKSNCIWAHPSDCFNLGTGSQLTSVLKLPYFQIWPYWALGLQHVNLAGAEMVQLIMLHIKKCISTMWNSCKYYPYLWVLFRSNGWNTWKWMLGYIWNDSFLFESLLHSNWKEADKLINLSLTVCFCHCSLSYAPSSVHHSHRQWHKPSQDRITLVFCFKDIGWERQRSDA